MPCELIGKKKRASEYTNNPRNVYSLVYILMRQYLKYQFEIRFD